MKKKFKKGFTLIETLVAVLILVTAIAGPLTIASKGLTTALIAKDQTVAYYLAQDAVEYVRFARDTNRLANVDWLAGSGSGVTDLASCTSSDGTALCYLDTLGLSPQVPTACTSGVCPPLNYDSSNHDFTYASIGGAVAQSIFTRKISITTPVCQSAGVNCNVGEAQLQVTVSWSDTAGVTRAATTTEDLYNWQ